VRLLDFNGDLKTAAARPVGLDFAYFSSGRAAAVLDQRPVRLELDGEAAALDLVEAPPDRFVVRLPRGQHLVSLETVPRAAAGASQP